ncbi:KPN_02809 family neutral zinc metallopeptidase [Microbacterium sp. YY-01]|uniref:KPN_02809 family neutral zinc metallopeptidase n=1 Tax=Microbacterium sp. YY-01 TaxID=3421634 RepID=UPI003D16EAA4
MTFNPKADVSGNKARRRGRTAAVAGGGAVGLGAVAVLLISMFTGVDLTPFLGGGADAGPSGGAQSEGTVISECQTGADANEADDCRIAAASLVLDDFWADYVDGYREPVLTVVDGSTSTQCGTASNAVGPFYCPPEEGVYIDPTFFGILRQQFGASAGELSQIYILAHEYGHHIQNITGIMQEHPSRATGATSDSVRMELQADCFAGAFIADMTQQKDPNGQPYMLAPTEQQIEDALNAAAVVGDDHIQQQSGMTNPESWTHGSSEQRKRWFAIGFSQGVNSCDTFTVAGNEL